jgi:hypothetical protein
MPAMPAMSDIGIIAAVERRRGNEATRQRFNRKGRPAYGRSFFLSAHIETLFHRGYDYTPLRTPVSGRFFALRHKY